MPIETVCTGCGQRLRVADEHAGKLAKCPRCQTTYVVPSSRPLGETTVAERAAEHPAATAAELARPLSSEAAIQRPGGGQSDQWHVLADDGRCYGPVSRSELDTWFSEGRIGTTTQIRREGQSSWQPASLLYPSLLAVPKEKMGQVAAASQNPFADHDASPHRPPITPGSPVSYIQPHRGNMVLTLGVFGLCCNLLGPVAWAMGNADLKEMNAGRMDPSGRSNTQAGMILGIVGTALLVLGVIGQVLSLAVAALGA